MDFRNIAENMKESTAMDKRGFKTLQRIPSLERLYLRFSSLADSSCKIKIVCLFMAVLLKQISFRGKDDFPLSYPETEILHIKIPYIALWIFFIGP